MNRIHWQDYITIAPDLHHGEACIRGTRIPVATILGSLADGSNFDEIKQAYPQLKTEDIQASLAYAAETLRSTGLIAPLGSRP
jgi:uncharacterized protein (DUF433 family)